MQALTVIYQSAVFTDGQFLRRQRKEITRLIASDFILVETAFYNIR